MRQWLIWLAVNQKCIWTLWSQKMGWIKLLKYFNLSAMKAGDMSDQFDELVCYTFNAFSSPHGQFCRCFCHIISVVCPLESSPEITDVLEHWVPQNQAVFLKCFPFFPPTGSDSQALVVVFGKKLCLLYLGWQKIMIFLLDFSAASWLDVYNVR